MDSTMLEIVYASLRMYKDISCFLNWSDRTSVNWNIGTKEGDFWRESRPCHSSLIVFTRRPC